MGIEGLLLQKTIIKSQNTHVQVYKITQKDL